MSLHLSMGSSQVQLNHTFDVSGIPVSNTGNAQDAATIVAEVLSCSCGTGIQGVLAHVGTQNYQVVGWVFS